MITVKIFIKKHIPIFIIKHFHDYYQKKLFKRAWISKEQKERHLDLLMDTNNICNFKCIYCYTLDDEKKKARFMTLDEFKYIAKNLFPFSKTVALSCATEPTLSKHFAEFIKISGTYNIPQTSFVTNGLLLNEEIITQSILNKIKLVIISIDAADKEMYEFIRVNGEFDKVINNLKLIRDLKIKYSSKLPQIQIQYTVFDYNINQSVDFVNKFHELFDIFFFSHLLAKKRNVKFQFNRVSELEFYKYAEKLEKICKNKGKSFQQAFSATNNQQNYNIKCPMALQYRLISSNGDITLCTKEFLCNVFKDDYFEIVDKSEEITKMINKKHPYCKLCMQ